MSWLSLLRVMPVVMQADKMLDSYEAYLQRFKRTGLDLPSLVNFRAWDGTEAIAERIRIMEGFKEKN